MSKAIVLLSQATDDMRYDVAVVGAGISGCIVSQKLATKGYKVCLIERKPSHQIGEKVCGDGVGKHEFIKANVGLPQNIDREVKGIEFYVIDKLAFTVEGVGYSVNRLTFGQELLERALSSGVYIEDDVHVNDVIIKKNHILGVKGRDKRSREHMINANIFVDSSGIIGAIRSIIPESWPVNENYMKYDIGIGYRELCYSKESLTEYCRLYYDWKLAPGGYCWIIPKKGLEVNIGILMPPSLTNAISLLERFKAFKTKIIGSQRSASNKGIGFVPLRTPLKCPSWSNLLVVGDAAFLANPLNGGGIGPAMRSASIAAEVIIDAFQNRESIEDRLWEYNIKIALEFGFKHAVNDTLKRFLNNSKSNEVTKFFKALGLKENYSSSNFLKELSKLDYLFLLFRLLRYPLMLHRLTKVLKKKEALSSLYLKYPLTRGLYRRWNEHFIDTLNSSRSLTNFQLENTSLST